MTTLNFIIDKYSVCGETKPFLMKGKVRKDLYVLFKELGFRKGAEIGVYKGGNSRRMLDTIPKLRLYCVDFWLPIGRRTTESQAFTYRKMQRKLRRYIRNRQARVIVMSSLDAVKKFKDNSLDFVYIDANHNFDFVVQDIIEWTKKVREGGIVSGHDYYANQIYGVVEAVKAYTNAHRIDSWFILDDEGRPLTNGGKRKTKRSKNSWFFVKGWED